ncbi:class I SAM-dependent methyltransferase [Sulfitobacter sediminilitoris]|nr:class I SAM-dependent methyltransferase [Sulfitobacter sediminilitoris]
MKKPNMTELVRVVDFFVFPLLVLAALPLKLYRKVGSARMPRTTRHLQKAGVFPIRDHYYEPQFRFDEELNAGKQRRKLPGIDLRRSEQLELLQHLDYVDDFDAFLNEQEYVEGLSRFEIENGSFETGDAEFLFSFVRYLKPMIVVEIGCGSSTKIIQAALKMNERSGGAAARHICIEPFEMPWLEDFPGIELVRERVESTDLSHITELLSPGDLLFIDSSHIIRPNGDVLTEYLEIVPALRSGVNVHVHDIFTPNHYPDSWLRKNVRFWNEQYLLEALLSNNPSFTVVAALNYLKHNEFESMKRICPGLTIQQEPGSFYFRVN